MLYRVLADLIILLHFLWILFLIFGGLFALKRLWIAWVHLGGLLFSLVLNTFGWYCPSTYLENDLRHLYDSHSMYRGPFIAHYLERVVYPELPEHFIRIGEIIFVLLYLALYAHLAKKHKILKRMLGA